MVFLFFFSSRRRHTRLQGDWSSDVCSSDLQWLAGDAQEVTSVDLGISRDQGQAYSPVALGLQNSGNYSWVAEGPGSTQCRLRVVAHNPNGLSGSDQSDAAFTITSPLGVDDATVLLALSAAPNPVNQNCRMTFALPRDARVRLSLFDLQGREVARLADGRFTAGRHELVWSGATRTGRAAPGLYFLR